MKKNTGKTIGSLALSDLAKDASQVLNQLRKTHQPVVMTHRGRRAAVIVGLRDYEDMIDELETFRDIEIATDQIARGEGITHRNAVNQLRKKLAR